MQTNAIVSQEQLAIESVKRLVNIVMGLKNDVFVSGVDFGIIPNTGDKPTLLQPGMEKLLKALHLRAEYIERSKIEDFDKPLIYYRYECRLIDWETGICVGTAIGSANSHEKKWRWRDQKRVCPVCGKAAIIKGKEEYGGGWLCFKKQEGCGAKFADGDKAIEAQPVGQIENPDIMDQMNVIDKISQKRALGSAIKTVANVSMLYTVDVEDFAPYDTSNVVEGQFTVIEQPKPAAPNANGSPASTRVISAAASTERVASNETPPSADEGDLAPEPDEAVRNVAGNAPTYTEATLGSTDMQALYNRVMAAKIGVKNWAHYNNLVNLLKTAGAIRDASKPEAVIDAIRQHEANKAFEEV